MPFENEGLPRFIDPDFREASVSDGDRLVLNVSQIYTNVDELLERHLLDPTVEFGLEDFFGDAETAFVFVQSGFGDDLARYVAETSAKLCRQYFTALYDQVNWTFVEHLDPELPDGHITEPELTLARQITRDAFDPNLSVPGSYGVGDLPHQGQLGILLTECIFFMKIGQGFRAAPRK